MLCLRCQKFLSLSSPYYLCDRCYVAVESLKIERDVTLPSGVVSAGLEYEGIVRELILRAKVKNDVRALIEACNLFRRYLSAQVARLDLAGNLMIAAPSSFWGRLNGRFDVANALCSGIFRYAAVYRGIIPGCMFATKRAGRNALQKLRLSRTLESLACRIQNTNNFKSMLLQAETVVVVDDVLTTGATMNGVMANLRVMGAKRVCGLVLAASSSAMGVDFDGS